MKFYGRGGLSLKNKTVFTMEVPSDLRKVKEVERVTEKIANLMKLKEDDKDSLAIAVTEIVANAITHGNKHDRKKKVTITFEYSDDTIVVTVADEGAGFDANKIDNPLDPENLLKESGRGIFIVKALMDEIKFIKGERGSIVRMVKRSKRTGS